MPIRILNGNDVRRALSMPVAIDAIADSYAACSSGRGEAPDRVHLALPGEGNVALFMPGFLPSDGTSRASLVVKAVTVFPQNGERGLPMNQGALLVLDSDTGCAVGLLDTAAVTAIRTAAGSGVATRLLARPDASRLAMLGAGALGPTHLAAVGAVRTINAVSIWSRTRASAERLADQSSKLFDAEVTVCDSADEAVRDADIVCTATPSAVPLYDDRSISPGTHINAVGAFKPTMCETPHETVARSRVFLDQKAAALVEAGDLLQAAERGAFSWGDAAGEIGQVLAGEVAGRTSDDEITLFKSVGMSLQDAAAAAAALATAEELDIGNVITWP